MSEHAEANGFIPLDLAAPNTQSSNRFNNDGLVSRGRGSNRARYGQGRGGQGRRGGRSSRGPPNRNSNQHNTQDGRHWHGNRAGGAFERGGGRGYNRGYSGLGRDGGGRMNNRSNNNRSRKRSSSNNDRLFKAAPVFFEEISNKSAEETPQTEADPSTHVANAQCSNILNIAVEGCCHGKLDQIYHTLQEEEQRRGIKIDLLICCGDMQTLRNEADYHSLAVPDKYKEIGTFYKYYSGEVVAPIPTIFVGGNHEASLPLQELFYGGWVAPNIYYMGNAGVVNFGGIRIAGLSGIYKSHDYDLGHHERPPYDRGSLRSVYHVRRTEIYRLCQLTGPVDIMISHDWPRGIERYGDVQKLLRQKKYFREEVQSNTLGSPAAEEILFKMKPKRWFAAHLHVKFEATVHHRSNSVASSATIDSPNKIKKPDDGTSTGAGTAPSEEATTNFVGMRSNICRQDDAVESLTEQMTKFLSLDKCLPKRSFLQIVQVERPVDSTRKTDNATDEKSMNPPTFSYDLEWLCILRKTAHLTQSSKRKIQIPQQSTHVTTEDKRYSIERLSSRMDKAQERTGQGEENSTGLDLLVIPNNFHITAPPHGEPNSRRPLNGGKMLGNPQTDALLDLLELPHVVTVPYNENAIADTNGDSYRCSSSMDNSSLNQEPTPTEDDDEIQLDDDDDDDDDESNQDEQTKEEEALENASDKDTSEPLIEKTIPDKTHSEITNQSSRSQQESKVCDVEQIELDGGAGDMQHSKKPRVGSLDEC